MLIKLDSPDLLRTRCYIGGQWRDADEKMQILNPANNTPLGSVPLMGQIEAIEAIEAASDAFQSWKKSTTIERQAILRRWADLITEHNEDLARILTSEQGKPLTEARGEITYAASFLYWFADEARRSYGETMPVAKQDQRFHVIKQPVGVVAAITPWNFPAAMITRKAGPALAAGCSFIIKPAPQTPFTALALAVLSEKAGIPAGVFNVITGDAEAIGKTFCASESVRKITFTGSTAIGKTLLRQSADTLKRVSLELGGNAPFIIFDDADLETAIEGVLASKYRNAGQTCVCANRIFVHSAIAEDFAAKLVTAVERFKIADGFTEGAQIGPLINDAALAKVESHVRDAIAKGAQLLTGGKSHTLGKRFYEPTVLIGATPKMLCFSEESFGPIAPLFLFNDEAQVIEQANNTRYGLASYIYTRDLARMYRVTEALEYGMVGVNVGVMSNDFAPFGGIKESGLGREGSHYGLEEYLEIKSICVGGIG